MYRVIWQVRSETIGPWSSELLTAAPLAAEATLFADLDLVSPPEPVFRRPPLALRAELLQTFAGEPEESADLAGYQHAFVADGEMAELLRERLWESAAVRSVEVQGRPRPAVRHAPALRRFPQTSGFLALAAPPTPDFVSYQGYLEPAPEGIDARAAWQRPGGRGLGVKIIDIESAWNFSHEDLVDGQVGVLAGINGNWKDHGTSVLGIVSGDANGFGVTGIVPEAQVGAISAIYDWQLEKWNVADAIENACHFLGPGDVLILEMHAPGPRVTGQGDEGFLPVEYWSDDHEAIKLAVAKGIYVVEASGNGSENLDHPDYGGRLARAADSGAILVGGGASAWQASPRSRIWWSNWGERLDLQGWGCDIVTAGGRNGPDYYDLHDHPEPSRCYTQSFGGTSGATPIVAGAVACLAGCLKAAGRPPLSPQEMRRLLVETGTAQNAGPDGPASEAIGPLPSLAGALQALGF